MTGLTRACNLNHQEALDHLRLVIERNEPAYTETRIRCVTFKAGDGWRNALCIIKVCTVGEQVARQAGRRYPKVHLLEDWIKPGDLMTLLTQIRNGSAQIDGEEVSFGAHTQLSEWEYLPSGNEFSNSPCHVYRSLHGEALQIPHHEPLLSYGLPFYPNPYFGIRAWCELRNFHMSSDARIGTLHVLLPHPGERFDKLVLPNKKLTISISGLDIARLKVKGAWEFQNDCSPFEALVFDRELSIEVHEEPDGFEVYLIGPDESIYDFHRETKFWFSGQDRVLGSSPAGRSEETDVVEAIRRGEGETTEFKPFLKRGDSKLHELVETIVAFANTKGGVILLGVDNHCSVKGIERDIGKEALRNQRVIEEELAHYIGWLKQSISGELYRTVALEISSVIAHGHTVVMVKVPEGEEKPYAMRTNAIYIRRGASNVIPDPGFELPQLYRSTPEQ